MEYDNLNELEKVLFDVSNMQEDWDLSCNRTECYWNLWRPNSMFNTESSKQCVSESLSDFKMIPNSTECPGYWDYEVACGCKKR